MWPSQTSARCNRRASIPSLPQHASTVCVRWPRVAAPPASEPACLATAGMHPPHRRERPAPWPPRATSLRNPPVMRRPSGRRLPHLAAVRRRRLASYPPPPPRVPAWPLGLRDELHSAERFVFGPSSPRVSRLFGASRHLAVAARRASKAAHAVSASASQLQHLAVAARQAARAVTALASQHRLGTMRRSSARRCRRVARAPSPRPSTLLRGWPVGDGRTPSAPMLQQHRHRGARPEAPERRSLPF